MEQPPIQGTSQNDVTTQDTSKYMTTRSILFSAYFVALVSTFSVVSEINDRANEMEFFFLSLYILAIDIVATIIFFIGFNATFKNVSKVYNAQNFKIGTAPTVTEMARPRRFLTIPYILVAIPGLLSKFIYDIQTYGGALGQYLYDSYMKIGWGFDLFFQILFYLLIPYTIIKIIIWLYQRLPQKNTPASVTQGADPHTYLRPHPVAVTLLSLFLMFWVLFVRMYF